MVFAGQDATSGIATCTTVNYSGPDGSDLSVNGSCTDKAGNTTQATSSAFNYDATAPTGVTVAADRVPDHNGWYNRAFVASWSGQDATSGIDTCTTTNYSTPDTDSGSLSGTCTDKAGNPSAAVAFTFKYDATAPTLSPSVSPNPVVLNGTATAAPNAQDNLSGIASQSCDPVNTSLIGQHEVTCRAEDNAGNLSSATTDYTVRYNLCVLYDQTKAHKSGSTVPIKLQLCDASGVNYSAAGTVVTASGLTKTDSTASSSVEDSGNANPEYNFRYDATLGGVAGRVHLQPEHQGPDHGHLAGLLQGGR